jgi:acyl carrier protein
MSTVDDVSRDLRQLLVQELSLDVEPEAIPLDEPLLDAARSGSAMALDSLDMLSLVLVIEERYGIKLPDDTQELAQMFASIRSLAESIRRLQPPQEQAV